MTSPHLEQRGIAKQADRHGWRPVNGYDQYPVYDKLGNEIGKRAKKHPDTEGEKYKWVPSKPQNPDADWYLLPGTKHHIKVAGGVAYLANGEASVLAMKAAGIDNVLSTTHGENTVPKNTIEYLLAIGVNSIINIADKDDTGVKAAAKWRDALRDSGIGYQAKQWPDYLPEKADFNDLWIHVGFDSQAAQKALNACEALILPQPEVKKPVVSSEPLETPQGLIDALASALRNMGHKPHGEWLDGLSIFRDEENASAGLNIKSGVYHDFGTGEDYSPYEVADRLGIPYKAEREKPQGKRKGSHSHEYAKTDKVLTLSTETLVEMPAKQVHINTAWIDQDDLPFVWVRALLALCHAKSMSPIYAIRLHHAIRCGELDGQRMTIKSIMSALGDAPRLSSQAFVNFLLELNFLWILDTNLLEEGLDAKSINKSAKRGRPETYYALNTHTDSLVIALAECLEPLLIERLSVDLELAPRSHTMRDSLDLSLEAYREWHARTNNPKLEYILKQVSEIISDLLTNTVPMTFTETELEHPSNLRAKLLNLELAPHSDRTITDSTGKEVFIPRTGIQLSKAKLALLLGCSESSLSNLYKQANVASKRVRGWHMVTNPNGTDIEKELREAPVNFNKELGGIAIAMYLKVWEYGKSKNTELTYHYQMDKIKETYERWNGRIQTLYVWIEQPSLLWNMNAEEIALKQANLEAKAELEADTKDTVVLPEVEGEKVITAPVAKPRKKATIAGKDRAIRGHTPEFLRTELEKEVRRDTPYTLKNNAIVSEETGEIIHSVKALREVVIWLNDYAAKAKEAAKPKPKPAPVAAAKPIQVPVKPKQALDTQEFDGWVNHPEEFAARMAALS